MTLLADFLRWLLSLLKACITKITTVSGMVITAVTGVVGFVAGLFGKWDTVTIITNWIDSASESLDTVMSYLTGDIANVLFGFIALDQLVLILVSLVSLTFGVVIIIFITILAEVVVLIPLVLGVRAFLKAIKMLTGGFVDP